MTTSSYYNNNGFFVTQNKSLLVSKSNLFYSYYIISSLLKKFRLIMEHEKKKMFYFSRLHRVFKPLPLNLILLEGLILQPKNTWHYLRFIFDRKLIFWQYIDFYTNKTISTIKYMKMLGNSLRGFIPNHKRLLYKSYILSIALYGFQLWYYNKALLSYSLKELRKI